MDASGGEQAKSALAFEAAQREVVERLAGGAPLAEILERIVLLIEGQAPELTASILLLDTARGCVRHGAAPHLPPSLVEAFDGVAIGPHVGSCGAAAYRAQAIIAEDISTHPNWADFKDLVLPHGLRGCWSTPVLDAAGAVLGTFAFYTREPRGPTAGELALVVTATHLAAVAIQHDRMRRRDSAQAALLDKARDAIIVAGLDGVVTYWNKGAERLYGWSARDTVGRDMRQILEGDPRAQDARRRLLHDGAWVGELTHVARGGREIAVETSWTLVRDDGGRPQSVLAIHTDVSDRKRLEAQVFRAQRMESLGTMAGGIAHDFNNILSAILGNSRLAATIVPDDDSTRECFDAIESACARAADLVRRILTFGRPQEAKRRVLEPRPVIEEAVALLRTSWPDVQFETHFASSTPAILADETQVHQIVMNLGTNAAQAMPGSQGRLEIRLDPITVEEELTLRSTELRPGAYARLSVRDDGAGMDEATLDRIFDPFFTTKPPGVGTGLGLSVVHGIVKTHGGCITVHSQLAAGSVFHIYLPAAVQPATRPSAAAAAEATPHLRGRGEHVLYVDDDEARVVLATRSLERLGYHVTGFTDASRAAVAFRSQPQVFDAVISQAPLFGAAQKSPATAAPVLVQPPFTIQDLGRALHDALATRPRP